MVRHASRKRSSACLGVSLETPDRAILEHCRLSSLTDLYTRETPENGYEEFGQYRR